MNHQSDLLDQYLDRLLVDPNAPIPPGLDADMAAFAHQMVHAEKVPSPSFKQQVRVWQNVLKTQQEEEKMLILTQRPRQREYALPLAAAVLMIIFLAGVGGFLRNHLPSDSLDAIIPASDNGNQTQAQPRAEEIRIGEPLRGMLSAEVPQKTYAVNVLAGQTVEIRVNADQPVQVTHSLANTPNVLAAQNTVVPVIVPTDTTLLIHIQAAPESELPFYFTVLVTNALLPANNPVQPLPNQQPPLQEIRIGEPITATLLQTMPLTAYTFVVEAGQIIQLDVVADQPVVVEHQVRNLPQIGNAGGSSNGGGGFPTLETHLVLPFSVNSQVDLRIHGLNDSLPATFTLTLTRLEAVPAVIGTVTEGTLTSQRNTQYFEFEGQRGDVVHIQVHSEQDADLTLALMDEAAAMLAQDDDSGVGYLPEIQSFQLARTGQYRLEVRSFDLPPDDLHFQVDIQRQEISLELGSRLNTCLGGKYAARAATFEGVAGEQYRLSITRPALDGIISVTILQNGEHVALMGLDRQETEKSVEFTVPQDGRIIISLNSDYRGEAAQPGLVNQGIYGVPVTLLIEKITE